MNCQILDIKSDIMTKMLDDFKVALFNISSNVKLQKFCRCISSLVANPVVTGFRVVDSNLAKSLRISNKISEIGIMCFCGKVCNRKV